MIKMQKLKASLTFSFFQGKNKEQAQRNKRFEQKTQES
jgi:hypothetical protein